MQAPPSKKLCELESELSRLRNEIAALMASQEGAQVENGDVDGYDQVEGQEEERGLPDDLGSEAPTPPPLPPVGWTKKKAQEKLGEEEEEEESAANRIVETKVGMGVVMVSFVRVQMCTGYAWSLLHWIGGMQITLP